MVCYRRHRITRLKNSNEEFLYGIESARFVEKVCVIGAGSTKYGKLQDNITDIALQASVDAIESAGMQPKEIQAAYISNVFGIADKQVHFGPVIMSNLGIPEVPPLSIESPGAGGSVYLDRGR